MDRVTAPVKYVKFVSTFDDTKSSASRVINPGPTDQWTPCEKGTRIARSGIRVKGLPAENAAFRSVVSLFESPGQSTKFPFESFNDEEALRDLELEVDEDKGCATVTVSSPWTARVSFPDSLDCLF
jgi:hypothetical protein